MEINKKNRTELKNYFLKNKKPTEQQFADFVDASINQIEDGVVKVEGNPLALLAEGGDIGTQEVLGLFSNFAENTPDWSFNLNPRVNPQRPDSNQPGLNIKDTLGQSRLFIRSEDGSIGMGTIEPESRLTIQGKGSLITAVSDTAQRARVFEVTQEEGSGIVSVLGSNAQEVVHLNGASEKPSFFLGKVGVGTNNPKANFQVSSENAELRITNTGQNNDTRTRLHLQNDRLSNSWEIGIRKGNGNLEFVPLGDESKRLVMKKEGRLELPGGVLFGSSETGHINADGAIYRKQGQAYLTVDDNFFIRDSGGTDDNVKIHISTDNSRIGIGYKFPAAPLSISGSGKEHTPNSSMHITNRSILFGGDNAGKAEHSAKIIARDNRLRIIGMASDKSNSTRKVEIFAEGGLIVHGRVSTPTDQLVAFSVSFTSNKIGKLNPLQFGLTHFNHGNHFKNGTHFIAPVKGMYLFSMCMRNNTEGDVGWRLGLNDTGYVNGVGAEAKEGSQLIANTKFHMNSRTVITLLNTGDKVHIEQFGSGGNDNFSSGFQGMLIQPLI